MQENTLAGQFEWYDKAGYYEQRTYGEYLKLWAEKYKDHIAIVEAKNNITYSQLDERSDRAVFLFLNSGIKKKEPVLLQLSNTISFAVACFGLFKMGAVPVLLYPALREKEIQNIIEVTKPAAYIVMDDNQQFSYKDMAERLSNKNRCIRKIISENSLECLEGNMVFAKEDFPQPLYSDTALLLLSGGSTGIPKVIARTHRDHYYIPMKLSKICKMNSKSVFLLVMPVSHNWNLCGPGLFGTLLSGGKVIMTNNETPESIFSLIEQEKVTMTALVPSLAALCIESRKMDSSHDISSLQLMQLGGAMSNQKLIRNVKKHFNCQVQQIYGMGEGFVCCTSLADNDKTIENCQGLPIAEYEIKVIDQEGNEVPKGKEGEIIVKGPIIISKYYNADVSENKKHFTDDGFFRTGDRAKILESGTIQVLGRINERINRAGEKIMPIEVEECLCHHPHILDAAVVPVTDDILGHRICAFIQPDNDTLDYKKVKTFLESIGMTAYKIPDQIYFLKKWPLTSVGKIDKKALIQKAEEMNCLLKKRNDIKIEALTKTEEKLIIIWKKILKKDAVERDDNFFELGGNSLLVLLLLSEIEKVFSVKIKKNIIFEHQILSDLGQEIDYLL